MSIKAKLMNIQQKLHCKKSQTNAFGKYKYRSCEDILEAVKPLLSEEGCVLTITDSIQSVDDRIYVCATVTIADVEKDDFWDATAFAREPLTKKGSDESQITGAASSYARKYALNGLFCIDDTKDADSFEPPAERKPAPRPAPKAGKNDHNTFVGKVFGHEDEANRVLRESKYIREDQEYEDVTNEQAAYLVASDKFWTKIGKVN